ncbi:MAG: response regulator transcription factor [Bacteroides sp.]|jgi:DNA-binding NarL/FixJ family response regulator|nr:response regulator transcription factor [Bacteroides sp.]
MNSAVKVFIADDNELIKQGISSWLRGAPGFKLIEKACYWDEFVAKSKPHKYLIVISTIQWIQNEGRADFKEYMKSNPSIKYIVIFNNLEVQNISELLQLGIKGFISNSTTREEFIQALEKVHEGNHYFSSTIFQSSFSDMDVEMGAGEKESASHLTNREAEVLEMISHGLTTKEIADRLDISKRTVDGHRARLLSKIGVKNTAGLVRYALGHRILKDN